MQPIYFILIIAIGVNGGTSQKLTPDVVCQQMSRDCLNAVMTNGVNPMAASTFDVANLELYCRDGRLTKMVDCVRTLSLQCNHSQNTLAHVLDYRLMDSSVTRLCRNHTLLRTSHYCLEGQTNDVTQFAAVEVERMRSEVRLKSADMSAMLVVQCRFMEKVIERLRSNITNICGSKVADLYSDFMSSFVPKHCRNSENTMLTMTPAQAGQVTMDTTVKVDPDMMTPAKIDLDKQTPAKIDLDSVDTGEVTIDHNGREIGRESTHRFDWKDKLGHRTTTDQSNAGTKHTGICFLSGLIAFLITLCKLSENLM